MHHIYSEASLGKAYLKAMGILPWCEMQPDFPTELLGFIMSSYYGGRSEVHLRRVVRQIVHLDFLSMYATVCVLQQLWSFVIAKGMRWRDTTQETRQFLDGVKLQDLQKSETFKRLAVIVQVQPEADVFPIRCPYGKETQYTIGLNMLTSAEPMWFSLSDCVVSKLRAGKPPKVLRAIAFEPNNPQDNLVAVNIAGDPNFRVEPKAEDFYKRLIELRAATKAKISNATKSEADSLRSMQLALKILASAMTYGIFVELNVEEQRELLPVKCFGASGKAFGSKVDKFEKPGSYFHPLLGTLITGAARLMLGVAEQLVLDAGLESTLCDTDSLSVAKPPGVGDAEFFKKVRSIQEWFAPLNPYQTMVPLLKIEDVNYRYVKGKVSAELQPLFCFAISAKRYALFNIDAKGRPVIRKASAHGLGHLIAPYREKDAPRSIPRRAMPLSEIGVERWQHDLWYRIVEAALNDHPDRPDYSDLPNLNTPAASRYAATTPHLLRWFDTFNRGKRPQNQVWPFSFMLAFQARRPLELEDEVESVRGRRRDKLPDLPRAVAPYHTDPRVGARHCFDRDNGRPIPIDQLKTYREVLAQYHLHPEAKFLNGDYLDRGPTRRRHIVVSEVRYVGKESNRWEQQFHLGAEPEAQIEYGSEPKERERFLARLREAVKEQGVSAIARAAKISRQHLYSVLRGNAIPSDHVARRLNSIFLVRNSLNWDISDHGTPMPGCRGRPSHQRPPQGRTLERDPVRLSRARAIGTGGVDG